jgi:hypothetical protein
MTSPPPDHTARLAFLGKSKTAAHRTVSKHLKQFPIDTRFSDRWMEALVQYHPNRSYPAANVGWHLDSNKAMCCNSFCRCLIH